MLCSSNLHSFLSFGCHSLPPPISSSLSGAKNENNEVMEQIKKLSQGVQAGLKREHIHYEVYTGEEGECVVGSNKFSSQHWCHHIS